MMMMKKKKRMITMMIIMAMMMMTTSDRAQGQALTPCSPPAAWRVGDDLHRDALTTTMMTMMMMMMMMMMIITMAMMMAMRSMTRATVPVRPFAAWGAGDDLHRDVRADVRHRWLRLRVVLPAVLPDALAGEGLAVAAHHDPHGEARD
jgi:hypothetical protein